ncbi:MAG: hypothetical protein C4321_05915, partial [Chloroflexota bacterium]
MRLAAELAEAMLADDRLAAVLATRVRGLLGLPLEFQPPNQREGRTILRALEADFWEFVPENSLYEIIVWGLLIGIAPVRLVWEPSDSGRVLPRLEPWHPRSLRYDATAREWRIRTLEGEISPQPGQWWLYQPYGAKSPWRMALWRQLAVPWLIKQDAARYWARDNEVGALRVGRASGPATSESRAQLARDLAELGSDTGIALPEGYDLQILSPNGDVWRSKQAAIEWADKALTIAVLGQNLTTDVQGGSLAAAQVHEAVRHDVLEADTQTLSTALRDGVLSWWAEFNYGNSALAPWPVWDTSLPSDNAQDADTLTKLAQAVATLTQAGAPVDVPALLQQYDVPMASAPAQQQMVRLASGDRVPATSGFVQGQLYADALVDSAVQQGRLPLQPILEAINRANDYEGLRAALLRGLPNLDADEFATVMEK